MEMRLKLQNARLSPQATEGLLENELEATWRAPTLVRLARAMVPASWAVVHVFKMMFLRDSCLGEMGHGSSGKKRNLGSGEEMQAIHFSSPSLWGSV